MDNAVNLNFLNYLAVYLNFIFQSIVTDNEEKNISIIEKLENI